MATRPVVLYGTLIGGILAPGGETTGFALDEPDLDVDASDVPSASQFSDKPCIVAGGFEERTFPLRGRVRILRAREIKESASALSRTGLRSTVFLTGTLHTGVLRPGGEGPGAELTNIVNEVDVSAVKPDPFVGKQVAATGRFEPVLYVTRGLVLVFKVTELMTVPVTPSFAARKASPENGVVQAIGVSAKFSLEEAMLDAVRQLPTSQVAADWLTQVHVESIDAEFGGFAGVSLLKVTVSAVVPKAAVAALEA